MRSHYSLQYWVFWKMIPEIQVENMWYINKKVQEKNVHTFWGRFYNDQYPRGQLKRSEKTCVNFNWALKIFGGCKNCYEPVKTVNVLRTFQIWVIFCLIFLLSNYTIHCIIKTVNWLWRKAECLHKNLLSRGVNG